MTTTGLPQHALPSKPSLPHAAPAPEAQQPAQPAAGNTFSSLDLLSANEDGGLPGLFRLLHDARDRDPHLLNRPMQELLSALENYLLKPRHLADAQRLKNHLLNSGIFLDAMLESGQLSKGLQYDLKAMLNKALPQLLPNQVLTEKSGGTTFEYQPETAAQILQKNLQDGQKAIIAKLLQTGPMLNEYQENAETPGHSPLTNRHLATWLGHAVEEALCHIVQQQLHSFSDENQRYWRFSLYAEQRGEVMTVPVEVQHATDENEPWLLGFTIKLPSGNTVKVSMQLEKAGVLVHFESDDILTQHRLSRRQDRLRQIFRAKGLTLESMTSGHLEKDYG